MGESKQERKSVLVRMSPELWQALSRWAQAEFRSINGQIEFLLHKAVQDYRRWPSETRTHSSKINADRASEDAS